MFPGIQARKVFPGVKAHQDHTENHLRPYKDRQDTKVIPAIKATSVYPLPSTEPKANMEPKAFQEHTESSQSPTELKDLKDTMHHPQMSISIF